MKFIIKYIINSKVKSLTMKCKYCSKKLSLACGIECRCGNTYCSEHRFEDSHNCKFDFKANDKKILEKTLLEGKSVAKQIEVI